MSAEGKGAGARVAPAEGGACPDTGLDATARIRALNDALRGSLSGGRVVLTCGVAAVPAAERALILGAVRAFAAFSADNDPYAEHDFGAFEVGGERDFWKIDAYDRDLTHGSPDPADPAVTTRVLTVMRADEY